MIIDAQLELSSAQAVTAAAASTNIVDLGAVRDIGTGEELYLVGVVTTTMDDTGDNSTLAVTLETDDNASFSSATSLQTLFTFPAVSAAGTIRYARIQPAAFERYIRGYYTPANGNLSAGAFDLFVTKDIQKYQSYASGFTVA